MKTTLISIFSMILAGSIAAEATVYYVDPNGSNANDGLAVETPWKTINYAQSKLLPGDTLYVRGGTHNEQVEITCTGREDAPITIAAYPGETPVLTNTVALTGWTACDPNDPNISRGAVRNENWPRIWVTTSTDAENDPRALFEKQQMLRKAIWPNQGNIWPNPEEWFPIPNEGNNFGQKKYLVDSKNLTQADDYWNGAQLRIWSHAANNWIVDTGITDFNATDHKITFEKSLTYSLSNTSTRPDGYAIMNSPMVLDEPGEWCSVKVAGGWRVYLWPVDVNDLETNLAYLNWRVIGQQVPGLIVCGRTDRGNYLTLEGLTLRNCRRGFEWVRWAGSGNFRGLTIRNCVVEQAYSSGAFIGNVDNLLIENCTFRDICADDYAVWVGSCRNPVVRYCTTENTCGTGIYLTGPALTTALVEGNHIGVTGMHGNGLTAYSGCANVLFARNVVRTPRVGITLSNSSNITIYANVVKNEGHGAQIAIWDTPTDHVTGYLRVLNNILIGSSAIYGYPAEHIRYVYNNIMSGTSTSATGRDYSIFVTPPNSLGPHESLVPNWYDVFVDPNKEDWHLKSASPAREMGVDVTPYLPPEFPNFDFKLDADGNPWGPVPDIGPYRAPENAGQGASARVESRRRAGASVVKTSLAGRSR